MMTDMAWSSWLSMPEQEVVFPVIKYLSPTSSFAGVRTRRIRDSWSFKISFWPMKLRSKIKLLERMIERMMSMPISLL